jgi:arsenate reductase-like glutaredoxin family protein
LYRIGVEIHYKRGLHMNIQIFGTKKSSDTRKAERFFKERGIKYQFIDMKEKELSKGEFNSVMQAVGGVDAMIDPACKDKDLLALVTYISADERAEKVMENQSVLRQPIVRNGRMATVGYVPDVWKTWK